MHGVQKWQFAQYLESLGSCNTRHPYAVILLNQPLHEQKHWQLLWEQATVRLCADGGVNHLYDTLHLNTPLQATKYKRPEYICGDMDSARDEVVAHFTAQGTQVHHFKDQDSTDLQKCLQVLRDWEHLHWAEQAPLPVLALGASGGRFDQAMHAIHVAFTLLQERRFYLLGTDSLTFLLGLGEHIIRVDREQEGPTCGLLPVGIAQAHITTHGLRWDLDNAKTAFGEMVSTSNELDSDDIRIETDAPLVWTVTL